MRGCRNISLEGLPAATVPEGADVTLNCSDFELFTHGSSGPLTVATGAVLRFVRCRVDTAPSITHGRSHDRGALQAFGAAENITVQLHDCEARLRETVRIPLRCTPRGSCMRPMHRRSTRLCGGPCGVSVHRGKLVCL